MNEPSVLPSTITAPFVDAAANATASVPGPESFVFTLPLSTAVGVDGRVPTAPTANCVLPTAPLNESLPATGRIEIVVLRVPVHPKLSVTVIATAPFSTVLVGVPDTMPVVGAIEMPAGSPVALHVKLDPVLPVGVKVIGPYAVLKRPSGSVDGFTVIVGQTTLSVKFCVASGGTALVAVNTSGNAPVCVAGPASTFVAGVNVTPVGSVPVCDTVGVGKPVVVTVSDAAVPTVKVALFALVIAGGCWTFSVKAWTGLEPTLLVAVKVIA